MTPGPTPAGGAVWDVVVIGTGLGGATLGHAIARAGHSVLFLEKGHEAVAAGIDITDDVEQPAARLNGAYWPERMMTHLDGRSAAVFPPLGCGVGGSSLLYAAALERFARSDIESVPGVPHPTGGWPFDWDELRARYAEAERLYRVTGTADPLAHDDTGESLRPPPEASPVDRELMRSFEEAGLNPYRLHVGIGYRPGCGECGGRVCPAQCKSDARVMCLDPATERHGATVLADSEVLRIEADRREARGVVFERGGVEHRVRGRFVVLAAGAYRSPALLLRSSSPEWPDGLANGSGQVGRNLMFHANEWFAVWPRRRASPLGPRKTIGLRDLYVHDGVRLGSIQSVGLSGHAGNIHEFLNRWFDLGPLRRLRRLRPALWIVAHIAQRVFGTATIFVMIVEDKGYADNRVVLDPDDPGRIVIEYRIRDELRERTRTARALIARALRGLRVMPLQADVQLNFGHTCGTCRAGHDPATSVLDGDCKAHEIDNLYVVDASFMPTSGGTNPGLTVIANALRVAEVLRRRLDGAHDGVAVATGACAGDDQAEPGRA